ncbi:DUF5127 domain-containing protein [archaeon]|nr:MAG: DUF5127 domain-containing protein [archaeon]
MPSPHVRDRRPSSRCSWSPYDNLFDGFTTHWSGPVASLLGIMRVDNIAYLFQGSEVTAGGILPVVKPTQANVTVFSTQTQYVFTAGGVALTLTYSTPLLPSQMDLMAQPSTYVTFAVASTDGKQHSVQLYYDFTGEVITNSAATNMSWARVPLSAAPQTTTLRLGATQQNPVSQTTDRIAWGYAYATASNTVNDGLSTVLLASETTRNTFCTTGNIPTTDDPAPSRAVRMHPANAATRKPGLFCALHPCTLHSLPCLR